MWCTISRKYVWIFQLCDIIQTDAEPNIVYDLIKGKKKIKSSTSRNPPGEIKETMESICYAHLFEKQQQRGGEMGWKLFWYTAFNTTSSVGEPQFKSYGSTFSPALERTLLQRETLGEIVSSERTWAAKTVNSSPSFTSPTACPNAKHTSC